MPRPPEEIPNLQPIGGGRAKAYQVRLSQHRSVTGPTVLPALAVCLFLAGCAHAPALGSEPIPPGDRPPWQTLLADSTFRIAMDTSRVQQGRDDAWLVWFVTTHARPQGPDSLRFDRGRIRLRVRCNPRAFKSVSEELALGEGRPVFHQEWPQSSPNAVAWRVPAAGATDDRFLRAACVVLSDRAHRASSLPS